MEKQSFKLNEDLDYDDDDDDYDDSLDDFDDSEGFGVREEEMDEIVADYVDSVLNKGKSSTSVLKTIAAGWGLEEELIKDIINHVINTKFY